VTSAPQGALTTRRRRVPAVVIVAIACAWLLVVLAQVTGQAENLHHGALIEGGLSLVVALGLFLLAWQVMIAAMMLPSSLPLFRLFATVSAGAPYPRATFAAFLAGYAMVWTGFGALAFLADIAIHHSVDASPWLSAHSWLIGAGVLALAGLFQFTPLKDRCLSKCRHPGAYLLPRYRRGIGSAFALGGGHGLFCLGCCWALMLVMFATGVANLIWMGALTALMVYEKTGSAGRRVVPLAGVVLLCGAALVLALSPWLPEAVMITN
jgi:predicted metal-binding membrane protein